MAERGSNNGGKAKRTGGGRNRRAGKGVGQGFRGRAGGGPGRGRGEGQKEGEKEANPWPLRPGPRRMASAFTCSTLLTKVGTTIRRGGPQRQEMRVCRTRTANVACWTFLMLTETVSVVLHSLVGCFFFGNASTPSRATQWGWWWWRSFWSSWCSCLPFVHTRDGAVHACGTGSHKA